MRRLLQIGSSIGVCLPKAYLRVIGAEKGDFLQVYLQDSDTLIVKRYKPTERNTQRYDPNRNGKPIGGHTNL